MKIDIITRHSIPNYGSILQTYSMQKALEKLAYESEIIDYIKLEETKKKTVTTNCHITQKGWKGNLKRIGYLLLQKPNVNKMNKAFEKYRNQYLRQTPKQYHSSEELQKNLPKADIYCTGSDQVWGKIGTQNYDTTYFLDFVPENKKCIAYAASFGVDTLPEDLNTNLKQLLAKYDTILVRENTAEDIIKQKGFENVKQVLDPTLLLDKKEWENICEPTKIDGKDYILVYQLHHNKQMEKYIRQLKKHTKLPIYRIHPSFYYSVKPGKFIYLPTPGQFVSYIKNARYVLTDSFHGTVFSLIFNTPFIDILPEKTGTRIESILKLLKLENRVLKEQKDFTWLEKKIDFSYANEILDVQRKVSIQALKKAIGEKPKNINQISEQKICCGCRCCEQICPTKAIHMAQDAEGFWKPVIQAEKCINCGLCLKRCPQIQENTEKCPVKGYAAKNKEEEELKQSSSGGIFSILAKQIIQEKGIVYGVAFDECFIARHIFVENEKELGMLRGSKYIQSDTKDTYSQVKRNLEEHRKVLYSGTPCQIAGLKQFLGKEYENLYTVDIVCHGVPSPKLFKKYKEHLEEKQGCQIQKYHFRDKTKKGWGLYVKVEYTNQKQYQTFWNMDSYYKSFLRGDTYRECCYTCKYANTHRVSDITLADFWGIEKVLPTFYDKNGVSAILVNSLKGEQIFEKIKDKMVYEEVEMQDIVKYNHNLEKPTKRPSIRNKIYNDIDNKSYTRFEKENLMYKREIKDIVKQWIPESLKRKIKNKMK